MYLPELKLNVLDGLQERKTSLAVLGMGYAGLPLALAFGKKIQVVGFDTCPEKTMLLRQGIDPSGEMTWKDFQNSAVDFTCYPDVLYRSRVFIVSVPTPVDEFHNPVFDFLSEASGFIGKGLKRGDLVIYESTVYPGCTEELCVPVLEKTSGLHYKTDFKVGYCPERINQGDPEHKLENTVKVVAGCDGDTVKTITALYKLIIKAGIHPVSSIKTAEMVKLAENTQRDTNIALANEWAVICKQLDINTLEVIEAASTKWNFTRYTPGLTGGHRMVSDAFYLAHQAKKSGSNPELVLAGRTINDSMASWLAGEVIRLMLNNDVDIRQSKVLVMGFTYKENISDIQNTGVAGLVRELQRFRLDVTVTDPRANPEEAMREFGIAVEKNVRGREGGEGCEKREEREGREEVKDVDNPQPTTHNGFHGLFDVVIVAIAHKEYFKMDEAALGRILKPGGILVDLKGIFRGRMEGVVYWSM
jgi:UDP-N-acetyl-D-galactosamine dehydrogenase